MERMISLILFRSMKIEDCKREAIQSMNDFILQFDEKHNKLVKININIPSEIVAFKIIKAARLTNEERLVVLTGLNYDHKEDLFDQAKKSLKKYKGGGVYGKNDGSLDGTKLESAFLTENGEALLAAAFTDASFANLSDGCSSMGAHVILVTGCGRNC